MLPRQSVRPPRLTPMSGVRVLEITPDSDEATLAAATDLFVAYRHFYERQGDDEASRRFFRRRVEDPAARQWVATIDDISGAEDSRVVGMVQIYPVYSSLDLHYDWDLNDLYVDPDARGTGAGRALTEAVLESAEASGASAVHLETHEDNAGARRLYETTGFNLSGQGDEFLEYTRTLG